MATTCIPMLPRRQLPLRPKKNSCLVRHVELCSFLVFHVSIEDAFEMTFSATLIGLSRSFAVLSMSERRGHPEIKTRLPIELEMEPVFYT